MHRAGVLGKAPTPPPHRWCLATLLSHSSLGTTRIYAQHSAKYLASRVDRLARSAYAG